MKMIMRVVEHDSGKFYLQDSEGGWHGPRNTLGEVVLSWLDLDDYRDQSVILNQRINKAIAVLEGK